MKTQRYTPNEKKVRHYYFPWKEKQEAKGIKVNVTLEEYFALWAKSGMIDFRGNRPMQYYLRYDYKVTELNISDCSIQQYVPDPTKKRTATRNLGSKSTPRHIKERSAYKYANPMEQQIAQRYTIWVGQLNAMGKTTSVTRKEFVTLWVESGMWEQRGYKIGSATLCYVNCLMHVTLADCTIKLREQGQGRAIRATPIVKPKRVKKERAVKPKRVAKKAYVKSPEQFEKQFALAKKRLEEEKLKMKQDESDIAVEIFYENSSNPINQRIKEVASKQPHSYEIYNIRTKQKLSPNPRDLAKYS
jgi:hypothetical protein